ncbi:MAG: hypothetical protein UV74_C0013G0266 [Candidatus Woesebacteria bacterium GW2011_GWB1_43_14]|uniref:UDP-N-acetylglucosamine--N-acetylmuramyl-(pentapeptide) pyrophosphoryl-undecaprenol N-acetylglucosamine transferase n=1 Tax=Candidatus Woesebacteria bacterium GW2011_GWB1_43_14 TaxID=1618578 RepID=A0A0G1DHI9_9BACT|nr:MAG: hypothetical protein UT21_C0002G0027 [Candidatus Woesebacteria bacterium GW2011_GWA1_39_11b]KKS78440.1 MAG: hypothetical protein UV51_C0001G0156 [Candidatus Woesebacteria bacterium GW2011_GWC1_42_9]KKS97144.1 MAG: hypothetical protein UV74_C0013G0266 [Candidatus Woesebacteria bacterium GW2011_GWB1_43_14]
MVKKVLLTGGHAGTTAIAVIQELEERNKEWKIYWIGARRASERGDITTLESKVFPGLNVHYCTILAGKLHRKWSIYSIISLFKIPFGFVHAFLLLLKIRPKVILSFGGFAAFPVVLCAWVLRIPIIIHEQTSTVGLANQLSNHFASKIAVSRKSSTKYFPRKKVVVTGNPVMKQVLDVGLKKKMGNPPTIYITGGSRGARVINEAVRPIIEDLLKLFVVYHQTGLADFDEFNQLKSEFPKMLSERYYPQEFFDPLSIDEVYRLADIVVGRSGANTVSEIISIKRPSVFIPIPWTRYDEQGENAKMAEKLGIALVINQSELTPILLNETILRVKDDWTKMIKSKSLPEDRKASGNLVSLMEQIIK